MPGPTRAPRPDVHETTLNFMCSIPYALRSSSLANEEVLRVLGQ